MNKHLLIFLVCLFCSATSFSQSVVVEPQVLRWDSSAQELGSTLLYRDTALTIIGSDISKGQFVATLDDSLRITNKLFVNSNLGVIDAGYRYGSYYVGGIRVISSGTNSLAMDRISIAGVREASNRANFDGFFDYTLGITPTQDSGAVVFGMGSPPRVINLCKFDRAGSILWNKKIAFSLDCYATDIHETASGNLYVAGLSISLNQSTNGTFLMKLNQGGDSLWATTLSSPLIKGYRLFPSGEDGLFVAGTIRDSTIQSSVKEVFFLTKVDTLGGMIWEKSFPSLSGELPPRIYEFADAKPTSDGGVIFLATAYLEEDSIKGERPYLLKVDAEGNYQWHKILLPENGDKALAGRVLPLNNGTYGLLLGGKPYVGNPYAIYALLGPDGTFTNVETATREELALTVSPNPAVDRVEISWTQDIAGEVEIRLLDVQGKILSHQSRREAAGLARMEVFLDSYPSGIYFVEILTADKHGSIKVVKR